QSGRLRKPRDSAQRPFEVPVNVGTERLERRDIHDPHLVGQWRRLALFEEPVDRGQERGQRLTGSGRRRDERVAAPGDRVPRALLSGGWLPDFGREPLLDERVEAGESHEMQPLPEEDSLMIAIRPRYRLPPDATRTPCQETIPSSTAHGRQPSTA